MTQTKKPVATATATIEPPTATATAEVQKPAEPTNEKIEELKLKRTEWKTKARTFPVDSKEEDECNIEAWKCGEAIKLEIASIKTAEAEAKKQEARSAKLALVEALLSSYSLHTQDESNVENKDNFIKAREVIENIVLGSVKHSPAEGKSSSNGNGSKGQTTAAIRAYARPFYDNATRETVGEIGKNVRKDLINQGFNDGTMNAAVRALEVELGLKD